MSPSSSAIERTSSAVRTAALLRWRTLSVWRRPGLDVGKPVEPRTRPSSPRVASNSLEGCQDLADFDRLHRDIRRVWTGRLPGYSAEGPSTKTTC